MKPISLKQYFLGLSRDSLVYGFGNAILRILVIAAAPIFTRVFLPADYGIINLITTISYFLSLLLIFGMDAATSVNYYQRGEDKKKTLSSAFYFLTSWGIVLIGVGLVLSGRFALWSFGSLQYRPLFLAAIFSAYFGLLVSFGKLIFRMEFQPRIFVAIALVQAVGSTGLMIYLVVVAKLGLLGYLGGTLIGTVLAALVALYFLFSRRLLVFQFDWPKLKSMLAYGAMMVPTGLAFYVFDLADRYFLKHYWNLTELGLYSIAINLAGLLTFFSVAIGQAWTPYVLKLYHSKRQVFKAFVPRVFLYYLIFFFSLAVLVTCFGQEILRLLTTPNYFDSFRGIGPMALAYTFSATLQITVLGMTIKKKSKYMAIYAALAAILNTGLNFLLIPKLGLVGAAWATALTYLFLTASYLFQSQKLLYVKLDWKKIIKLVLLSAGAIILLPLSWRYSFGANLVIKIAEFGGFIFLLYLLDIINRTEAQSVWVALKERSQK